QNRLRDATRRGLAVRARHMDHRVRAVRVAQQLRGAARRLQPRLRGRLSNAGQQLGIDALGVARSTDALSVAVDVPAHARSTSIATRESTPTAVAPPPGVT